MLRGIDGRHLCRTGGDGNSRAAQGVIMTEKTFDAYNIGDLREIARRKLPKGIFEFVDRGTEDEVSLRENRAVFERIRLLPRTLVDVSGRSQEISLFGHQQKMPIAIAPTGSAGLTWYNGEIALARAAAAAGIPFTLATGSTSAMERIVEQAGGRLWFQLYMWPDRSLSHKLVERAKAAGYEGLVIAIDSPVPGSREYNLHNGFTVPFSLSRRNVTDVLMHPRWLMSVLARYVVTTGIPRYENYPSGKKNRITSLPMGRAMALNDSLTWDDLRDLRKLWPRKLMVKGLLHPQDAVLAADCGVDGVILSNHGGRVVDGTPAPIEMVPQAVEAVGKRIPVLVDSGFRRGSDIVKALALGASAVLVGRATLYGTAVGGEAGAARAIGLLREEIDRMLALLGCRSVAELGRQYLVLPRGFGTCAPSSAASNEMALRE
jgi:isopentenyl diphosphate isomerase/L-lactate dehydrogenase-like FMN-dependent dehydrogenase